MPSIIFMGTPDFAATVLQGLIEADYDILAVVTQPDRPKGRKRVLTPSPVKELAQAHGLTVYQPEKLTGSAEEAQVIDLQADLIITAAYGQFLSQKLLNSAQVAAINVHASLLPKYRGGAPIHHALYHGEEETGISIIYMTKQMDAGDIIEQAAIPIEDTDTTGDLFVKLANLGRDTLLETIPALMSGDINPQPQEASQVTYSPNITPDQERIDWSRPAQAIDWHVRALTPFPSAYTLLEGDRVKIWRGQPVSYQADQLAVAGTIVASDQDSLIVQAGQGTYYAIQRWQQAGKKAMEIADFLNGQAADRVISQVFDQGGQDEN